MAGNTSKKQIIYYLLFETRITLEINRLGYNAVSPVVISTIQVGIEYVTCQ